MTAVVEDAPVVQLKEVCFFFFFFFVELIILIKLLKG